MTSSHHDYTQTMDKELHFVNGAGTYGCVSILRGLTPDQRIERTVKILEGYVESLATRTRWFPGVNVDRLRARATRRIEILTS